jgi:hypothetical protein
MKLSQDSDQVGNDRVRKRAKLIDEADSDESNVIDLTASGMIYLNTNSRSN